MKNKITGSSIDVRTSLKYLASTVQPSIFRNGMVGTKRAATGDDDIWFGNTLIDKEVLINLFGEVETGILESGTAIGTGLATAVNRLRESEATSKVIILLTDGVNNQGKIHPLAAADIAAELLVRQIPERSLGRPWRLLAMRT